jgi:hypothetical protein
MYFGDRDEVSLYMTCGGEGSSLGSGEADGKLLILHIDCAIVTSWKSHRH